MTLIFIIVGILAIVFLGQTKSFDKNTIYDSYSDEKNEWSILSTFAELKILSKYAGELRFGPTFIHIKTDPINVFGKEFYGDWFFRTQNGIYLQKWNSNPIKTGVHTEADNDLIYYDFKKNKTKVLKTGIKSFHWTIEKKENDVLVLITDNGKIKSRIEITNANSG
ncbi:hypothetical protein M9Q43_13340 [Flavobacterium sp. HXWNR29]|uniref:hypothetical protein n=1 Tax=Flavobacterium odoriferum TaxID=2946604 RepID=UPI0021CB17A7|nr:hypothetical protein [Flavobacterium sp. HXWNR29]MCU4190141.1 hypothetical protein [Flavobacterium sp. HXWNR29]